MNQKTNGTLYDCDITYGTSKEFGFDFLRDRLLLAASAKARPTFSVPCWAWAATAAARSPCKCAPSFVLVDEADSILIDEARTPLIISAARAKLS